MKKALILIGEAAGGHIACARALQEAFEGTEYEATIGTVGSYDNIYLLISRYRLLEAIFNFFCILANRFNVVSYLFSKYFVLTLSKNTRKILEKENPDIVLSNHAMTALAIGNVKKDFNFKFIVTVPDLITVSRVWIESKPDILFSPTKECTQKLREYEKDIPIMEGYYPLQQIPEYSQKQRESIRENLLRSLGLEVTKPTILITGCGLGTRGIIEKMSRILVNSKYQFIILVGKDKRLKDELQKKYIKNSNILINGYTDRMQDFIISSDIVIAKPGPATVLEVEGLKKKAIFTYPVGYQEWGNVDYLIRNPNFKYIGRDFTNIQEIIDSLLSFEYENYSGEIHNSKGIVNTILEEINQSH
jgi:processive 1,2-diacylglycerol beta-glucosyltransferase